jgi:hypothetical protein
MNDVNELWNSPWLTLQKNLASGLGVAGSVAHSPAFKAPVQGRALPTSSWLVRARSRTPKSRTMQ